MKEKMKEKWNSITWDAKTIGLAAGWVGQIGLILTMVFVKIDFLASFCCGIWWLGVLVSNIFLFKYSFRRVFNLCKKLFVFGWFVVPFPMDLVTGMACVGIGLGLVANLVLFLPAVLASSSYSQAEAEGK